MANTITQQHVRVYLVANTRPLDLALYDFHFGDGIASNVLVELKKFQNSDGGFGKCIEPDFQLPDSSALGTTLVFQYLDKLEKLQDDTLAREGISYFLQSYDEQKQGWNIVPKAVNNFPHAPWWEYKAATTSFGWGNPAAEILGYLLQYQVLVKDRNLLDRITAKALERLNELTMFDEPDFHELLCYVRLYQHADEFLRTQIYQPLANLISKVVNLDPNTWGSYVAVPLTFIKRPDSPFIELFDAAILKANLDHLKRTMVNGDHWEPTWNWAGAYPEVWEQAKQAWSGKLTVENMMLLQAFGE